MENTIQGLLDFARPPELHRVHHDLRTTVRRALNLVEGRAKHQNVAVVEQLPETPVIVDGDPEQLHQILVNLSSQRDRGHAARRIADGCASGRR